MEVNYAKDFPIIKNLSKNDKPYIYLDNASTTLKPNTVIDAVTHYYTHCGANIHRGNYQTSEYATLMYEESRDLIAGFINAKKHEIIFTHGTTDSINYLIDLLALSKNDVIVNFTPEHHSNFIPWQERANLITLNLSDDFEYDLDKVEDIFKKNTVKLLTTTCASNVTGNIPPLKELIKLAKRYNVLVCLDGAQILGHRPIDLYDLSPDFFVFSAHKMFGPSGTGVLYIRENILEQLSHKRFGGGMVNVYQKEKKIFKRAPLGLEPGTPSIEAVIGFGAAIQYIQNINFKNIESHLDAWSKYFLSQLSLSKWSFVFPKTENSLPIFTLMPNQKNADLSKIARLLSDTYNIAVNDGQHCCGPLYETYGIANGLRVSGQIYNTLKDIDIFFESLEKVSLFLE